MTYYISPYRRLASLRNAMNRMMEDTMAETSQSERDLLLAVDVQADEAGYHVIALVPGLDAGDLDIEILNNTVTIRGEFKSHADENTKFLVNELPDGSFSRVITLPTAVDSTKTEANIKDGLLRLNVPKAEAHRPKSIKIVSG